MHTQLSVIICCHNAESRIVPTLEHLLVQKTGNISWELIVVDNNCTDQTTEVARRVWGTARPPLRIVRESIPGLIFARKRGIAESNGAILMFCDDDNWPEPDYLQKGYDFLSAHPKYGAIAGWGDVVVDHDTEIPQWFEAFQTKYACGKYRKAGEVNQLYGAGCFVRKECLLAMESNGFDPLLTGRKGSGLDKKGKVISGDDIEMFLIIRMLGYKLYFSESMYFRHYIPKARLTESYLLRMAHGNGRATHIIAEYNRLADGGIFARMTLFLLPVRVYLRRLKRQLRSKLWLKETEPGLPQSVMDASASGMTEYENEIIRDSSIWTLAKSIKKNLPNDSGNGPGIA